jgi:hypothetical protein
MHHKNLLLPALFTLLLAGCSPKSPYDISPADVEKHQGGGAKVIMKKDKGGVPERIPGAKVTRTPFKKGEKLPNGEVADRDLILETQEKTFHKGDQLPDGTISDGERKIQLQNLHPAGEKQ